MLSTLLLPSDIARFLISALVAGILARTDQVALTWRLSSDTSKRNWLLATLSFAALYVLILVRPSPWWTIGLAFASGAALTALGKLPSRVQVPVLIAAGAWLAGPALSSFGAYWFRCGTGLTLGAFMATTQPWSLRQWLGVGTSTLVCLTPHLLLGHAYESSQMLFSFGVACCAYGWLFADDRDEAELTAGIKSDVPSRLERKVLA